MERYPSSGLLYEPTPPWNDLSQMIFDAVTEYIDYRCQNTNGTFDDEPMGHEHPLWLRQQNFVNRDLFKQHTLEHRVIEMLLTAPGDAKVSTESMVSYLKKLWDDEFVVIPQDTDPFQYVHHLPNM